jgi:hypothetical protein
MIEVFPIPITKAQLRVMPAQERHLLLLASHTVNQISVVQKLLLFSVHYRSETEIENRLSGAQSQTILRLLFGNSGRRLGDGKTSGEGSLEPTILR